MPSSRADSAIACAWLPDENATTPALRWRASNCDSALKAPRNLNAPMRWKFSHLKKTCAPSCRVGGARAQHRRAVGVAGDARRGGGDVVVGRKSKIRLIVFSRTGGQEMCGVQRACRQSRTEDD